MKQKLLFVSVIFFLFINQFSHSQSTSSRYLVRATTSIAGSSEKITLNNYDLIIQQSIGQSSVIGAFYQNNFSVRQGFIQPNSISTKIALNLETFQSTLESTVHPNPFKESITLSFSKIVSDKISITVFDILGRMVFSND